MRGRSTTRNGHEAAAPEGEAVPVPEPLPDPALAPGATAGGFTVTDVLGELDAAWTVADGTDAEGRPGRVWISTAAAAGEPAVREHVARLARLRGAPRSADQPLAPFTFAGGRAAAWSWPGARCRGRRWPTASTRGPWTRPRRCACSARSPARSTR
jgi:hypothetical protein